MVALNIPLALEFDYLVPCAATSAWTCEGGVAWTLCSHMTTNPVYLGDTCKVIIAKSD